MKIHTTCLHFLVYQTFTQHKTQSHGLNVDGWKREEGRMKAGFLAGATLCHAILEKDSDLRSRSWKWRGPMCTWTFGEPYGTFTCGGAVDSWSPPDCSVSLSWVTLWLGYSFTLRRWPDSVASLKNAGADCGAAVWSGRRLAKQALEAKKGLSILDTWKRRPALGWTGIQESWVLASALQPCRSTSPF